MFEVEHIGYRLCNTYMETQVPDYNRCLDFMRGWRYALVINTLETLTCAVFCALQRADMSVQAASEKVVAAQQLVPSLPGIDPALVACMRKGLFVNMISGALSQCAATVASFCLLLLIWPIVHNHAKLGSLQFKDVIANQIGTWSVMLFLL